MNRKERRNKKKELNILNDLITVINQYFPELINKFNGLTDLRNQSYVKYQMKVIFIVRLMGLMCEINAFKRLAKKVKKEYPRLKIIIGADALYASKAVMDICKENESKKENYEYVTKLDYQEEKVNIIKHIDKEKNTEFLYMTDLPISNKNIESTINLGRKRWKIENKGFNIQKI